MDDTNARAIFEETLTGIAPRLEVFSFSQEGEFVRASLVINFEGPEVASGVKGNQVIFGFGQIPLEDAGKWYVIRDRLEEVLTEEEQGLYLNPLTVEEVKTDPPIRKTKRAKSVRNSDKDSEGTFLPDDRGITKV